MIGWFFSPFITVKFRVKKFYLLAVHIPFLGAWGIIGLGLVLSHRFGLGRQWLLNFVIVMSAANCFFQGFTALPHNEYVAACIPMSHRGRFSGYSYTIGQGLGVFSNLLGGWILWHIARPMSFGYLYVLTWFIIQCGYMLAMFGRERPTPVERCPKPWSKTMVKAVLYDKPYMRVLLLNVCYGVLFTPMLINFVPLYGFTDLRMLPVMAAVIGLVQRLTGLATSSFLGHAVDKVQPETFSYLLASCSGCGDDGAACAAQQSTESSLRRELPWLITVGSRRPLMLCATACPRPRTERGILLSKILPVMWV